MEMKKILDVYFENNKYPFTSHHLDSFRELIKSYIPKTIKSYNPITMIKYDDVGTLIMKTELYVGNKNSDEIYLDRPIYFEEGDMKILTPNDARLRNLTYESHLYANVFVEITDYSKDVSDDNYIISKTFNNVAIGSIPIMLHSDICILNGQGSEVLKELGECIYDTGGYFIIDGKEKVIVAQERNSTNKLFVLPLKDDNKYSHKAFIFCAAESGETMLSPKKIEFYINHSNKNEKNNTDTIDDEDDSDEEDKEKDNQKKQNKNIQGSIEVKLPFINKTIPLVVFFRALGIESDKDIYESIFGIDNNETERIFFDEFIKPSLYDIKSSNDNNKYIFTQQDAFESLLYNVQYNTLEFLKFVFTDYIFPNIDKQENKGKYLGYLVKQIFNTYTKISPPTDKDSYVNKRVDISGYLLAELFHESYSKLHKHIRDKLDYTYYYGTSNKKSNLKNFITEQNIFKIIDNLIISQTFAKSLKGAWGTVNELDPELGRVQDLSRISYIGFLSHLRRVNLPLDRSIKVTAPHKLHCQQYGIMCPFETPDGASVGYLKNLAFLTKIAPGADTDKIKECLIDIGVIRLENYSAPLNKDITKVILNGTWYGITTEPNKIIRTLKAYRRNSLINILTSLSWNVKHNEIRINIDAGRPCRPLIIAEKIDDKIFKNVTNWFHLITGRTIQFDDKKELNDDFYYRNIYINPKSELSEFKNLSEEKILEKLEENGAYIEYLDSEESDASLIAMNKDELSVFHTHLEIHPSTMFSVVSANIPLSNHNQSARNVFHAAQSKQAIGIYATNFNKRFDTMCYVQHYPQRPIITTQLSQYTCSDSMPNGFNVIVAIMTYSGFNQEDSIMINKNSIERGLFNLSYYKSVTGTAKEISPNEKIIFANPTEYVNKGIKVNNIKHANYNLLDDNGFIKEHSKIPYGQKVVVIGMLNVRDIYKEVKKGVFTELIKETVYTDVSIVTDKTLYGTIDKVFYSKKTIGNNSSICKVRFLKVRKPEFGDKHASRHGQKGVIGMLIPEENMPYTKDGIRPDIIINPHAIPSRMTIGHLVECVFSKLCCIQGGLGDGSVYIPFDKNKIYSSLEEKGFNSYGNEILYNGFTGKQISTEIFIGPTFYFRLKHMVADKINSRGHDKDKSELPKVMLTRQPTSGRRKGGGLRIGEMERDSILSHGTSLFLQESMMERSDKYSWAVCKRCGTMVTYNPSKKNRIIHCRYCNKDDIAVINTPYSFKLLNQELQTMGIEMKINTEITQMPFEYILGDNDFTTDSKFDYNDDIEIGKLDINDNEEFENTSNLIGGNVYPMYNQYDEINNYPINNEMNYPMNYPMNYLMDNQTYDPTYDQINYSMDNIKKQQLQQQQLQQQRLQQQLQQLQQQHLQQQQLQLQQQEEDLQQQNYMRFGGMENIDMNDNIIEELNDEKKIIEISDS